MRSGVKDGWFGARWRIFRAPGTATSGRTWALGEIVCATLTIATLTLAVGAAIARFSGVALPWWLSSWPLQILLAGSVGYGTNFLAVQMLFKPREPFESIPMRWIWRQGLIPAKQQEMAIVVGEEVATRLLTPESIVDEVAQLIEVAFDDPPTLERLQAGAVPLLKNQVPAFIRRFLPEALVLVQEALQESLPADKMRGLILDIVDGWFAEEANRVALRNFILQFLRARTPMLVDLVKTAVKRYKKKGMMRSFGIGMGESTGVLNWKAFEKTLKLQLDRPKSARWAESVIDQLRDEIRKLADQIIREEWLESVRSSAGELALQAIEDVAETAIIPRVAALLESEDFRHYVKEELVPGLKPRVIEWIKDGHLAPVLDQFNVKGRVTVAAGAMDVQDLENMANRVGAVHFGAIQVLGYFLGVGAGVLMVLVGGSPAP